MRSIVLYFDDPKSTAAVDAVDGDEARDFLAGKGNDPLQIIARSQEEDEDY